MNNEEFVEKHKKIVNLIKQHTNLRNEMRAKGYSRVTADEIDKVEREFIKLTGKIIWGYGNPESMK